MAEKMFMRVGEASQSLEVSRPYEYKLIRQLNEELKKKVCIIIAGRIDRKYFYEKFYGSHTQMKKREGMRLATQLNIQREGVY